MKNKMLLIAVLIGSMFHLGCGGLIKNEPQPQESCYSVCGQIDPACFQTGTISSEECPSPSASECVTLTEPSSDCRCYALVKGNWLCLETTGIPSPLEAGEAKAGEAPAEASLPQEAGEAEAGEAGDVRQVGCIPACQEGESCYTVCGEIGSACFTTGLIQANGCPSATQQCLITDAGTGCSIAQ